MANLTDRLDVLCEDVFSRLTASKVAIGLEDVWMGDQERVPRTPSAAVEPGPKSRDYNGAPRRFLVTMDVYVMVYLEKVQAASTNVRASMKLTETVEEVLHANAQLGGLVIASYVYQNEPGFAERDKTMFRASRITFRCTSQAQLPMS